MRTCRDCSFGGGLAKGAIVAARHTRLATGVRDQILNIDGGSVDIYGESTEPLSIFDIFGKTDSGDVRHSTHFPMMVAYTEKCRRAVHNDHGLSLSFTSLATPLVSIITACKRNLSCLSNLLNS